MEAPKTNSWNSTVVLDERLYPQRASVREERHDPPETLEPGTRLGNYLIISRLGGGGMGVVYKAQDLELERTVALKILPPHLCRHPEYVERFRAEAQAQARLNHPHVVTLYSFLELPVGEVLVLEYVEGQTLEQRLRRQGPLSPQEAVAIFEQALRGVEHIHARGVVHRDLKPANLFITRDGTVKLMDFGVARLLDGRDLAQRGAMVGTLLYISPEQINGRETDFRSDIYTLGVSLFEAVTGRLPFERRTDYALMHAHVQETPPRPKQFQRRLPPALEWVILKAIEKEPARRFQSAAEFRAALLKLGLVERRQPRPDTKRPILPEISLLRQEWMRYRLDPRTRWLGSLWFDVALLATVLGLVFLLGLFPSKAPPPEPSAAAPAEQAPKPLNARARSSAPQPPTPSPARTPLPPPDRKDQYEALRQAWGE